MKEPRRFPRRNTEGGEFISIPTSLSVKILDVSVSGALVESPNRVDPDSRGRLRLNLDGTPITIEVQILRVAEGFGTGSGYRLGTRFLALDLAQQQLIESFVRQES